jgi:hypothetical protein
MKNGYMWIKFIHDNVKDDYGSCGHKNDQNKMNSQEKEPTMTKVGLILIMNTK